MKIINVLTELFVKLKDGNGNVITSTGGKLDVNAQISGAVTVGDVIIRDASDSAKKAMVDAAGNLKVITPPPSAPAGKTRISREVREDVLGGFTNNSTYVIPNGQVLVLQYFEGGARGQSEDSRVALYYAPAGILNGTEVILANGYVSATNYQKVLDKTYTGNGTAAIIMQRRRYDGGTREMYTKWEGYY